MYLGERCIAQQLGPAQATAPTAWQQPIAEYCLHAAAAGGHSAGSAFDLLTTAVWIPEITTTVTHLRNVP